MVVVVLWGGACSNNDTADVTSSPTSSSVVVDAPSTDGTQGEAEAPADLERYCNAAKAYHDTTAGIDVSGVESMLNGFEESSRAAQAAADAAPSELRQPLDVIAAASADLSTRLRASQPASMGELQAQAESLIAELEGAYGDLEAEAARIEAFDTENCGLTFE